MTIDRISAAAVLSLVLTLGCSSRVVTRAAGPAPYADTRPIPEPAARKEHSFSEFARASVVSRLKRLLNPAALVRGAVRSHGEAQDIHTFDDVPPSSWFQHRNAHSPMSPDQIFRGPNREPGPATDSLVVVGAKSVGITPGFRVKDALGTTYHLKFDPAELAEMGTAAEVISTKLFYAAGYNTPENYIVVFAREQLRIHEGVEIEDERGRRTPLTPSRLDTLLVRVARTPAGRIRAVASKQIPGKPKGPFTWKGRRADDPNDVIPHQHRRVLRGLYPFCAWLNHVDLKSGNTFDSYVEEGGRGYLRHYFLDFGSTLGSGAVRPHNPRDGAEYDFDLFLVLGRSLALGAATADWADRPWAVADPSLGYFPRELDPGKWRPTRPTPPFDRMSDRDGYWGAKLVRSFSDEQIEAAVAAGALSNPAAAKALTEILEARRDRTAEYWFVRVTPLEEPAVETDASGRQRLRLVDYARRYGVVAEEGATYRWEFRHEGLDLTEDGAAAGAENSSVVIVLPGIAGEQARRARARKLSDDRSRVAVLRVRAEWPDRRSGRPATLYLRIDPATGVYELAGLEH